MGSRFRWRRLGWLTGLALVGFALGNVVISTWASIREASRLSTSAADAVFAAGARGDRATAGSNYQLHCASCHGVSGKGDGWTAWLLRLKMRDLGDPAYVGSLSDDYLFQVIKHGGASLGKPGMPSWGQELTDGEIMELVVYIQRLAAGSRPDQPAGTAR